MTAALLSVDFDFFVYSPEEDHNREFVVHPGTTEAKSVPPCVVFDWSHSESFNAGIVHLGWISRAPQLASFGHDPAKLMAIRPGMGCVSTQKFSFEIARRFLRVDDASLWYADSHAYGFAAAREAARLNGGKPVKVLHFDAHADLGYKFLGYGAIKPGSIAWRQSELLECGSWLFAALDSGAADRVEIVYPDWKGVYEWSDQVEWQEHIKPHKRHIHVKTWSEFLAEERKTRDQVRLTVAARSSAWTPPWSDGEFAALLRAMPCGEAVCLDCGKVTSANGPRALSGEDRNRMGLSRRFGTGADACSFRHTNWTPPSDDAANAMRQVMEQARTRRAVPW